MADAPAVSVIIATYNRGRFLRETVESVLGQRFRDFELIVVDDGSTDDTRNVMRAYGGRLRYFYQDNRGPSAARNFGVLQAQAPWIAFQDSDDLSLPGHLEALYAYAQGHPDCCMVFANGAYLAGPEHHRETLIAPQKSRRLAAGRVTLRDLFDKSIVRLQAALISKKAYEAVGGHDESLRICMDLDLAFRFCMTGLVTYLDEVVFLYRKHEGNIGRNEELRLTENIRVIEKLIREFPRARALLGDDAIKRRVAYRCYRLAKSRHRRGAPGEAAEAIAEAVSLRPYFLKYRLWQLLWVRG